MAKKKINKEESGPTYVGVFLAAICMAGIGALLGFAFLSSFPIKAVASAEDHVAIQAERSGRSGLPTDGIYYEAAVARDRTWSASREVLVTQSAESVVFSFEDLNAWAVATFRPGTPPAGTEQPNFLMLPGTPKFGADAAANVYMTLPVVVNVRGHTKPYKLIAKGSFIEGTKEYQVESIHVNNALLPMLPSLSEYVFDSFFAVFEQSEEYKALAEAWESVESVEVTEDSLKLVL